MTNKKLNRLTFAWRKMRRAIEQWMQGLFGHDEDAPPLEDNEPDRINQIKIEYVRVTKIDVTEDEGMKTPFLLWDYREELVIDRLSGVFEYRRHITEDSHISHRYESKDWVSSLLDHFDEERLFSHVEGNPEDVVIDPDETMDYKLTVDYERKPTLVLEGSYDKKGLPDDFGDFIESVINFVLFYGIGEVPDPSFFNKVRRREGEYIYCSVLFKHGFKTYYYLTEDDSIKVGDLVIAPAGSDNHETIVEVVKIEYFQEEDVPFALDKTKSILRKCTEDDLKD